MFCVTILTNSHENKGPNYWKLNTSILKDQEYKNIITSFWDYWIKQKSLFKNLTEWRDVGKNHIKSLSISYSTNKQKNQKYQIQTILDNLSYEKNLKTQNINKIQNLQQQLIFTQQNEGVSIRSKQNVIEKGETPFQQEKINQTKKHFSKLKIGENTHTTNPKIIQTKLKQFYKELYAKPSLCEET